MDTSCIKRIIYTSEELQAKAKALGRQISDDYRGKHPVLISVLKGTLYFLADLTRNIDIPVNIDFMSIGVFSGSAGNSRTGIVRITKDLDTDISGRHVLMVEDIINTGLTMGYLIQNMRARQPADIKICTLLNNPAKRLVSLPIAYTGFESSNSFLVGYGLDYKEEFRHLPYIGEFDESMI
ncbi:MAG: hypoxanthine phosphoribosyltransferase [Eubacteriales bacterium]|nr:hypoxanthine phosphoribosyltransferase [Eubacteriales bacterium]